MTRKPYILVWPVALLVGLSALPLGGEEMDQTYDITATVIEACSCPLFCPCYYDPPEPSGGHLCEFNMAYKFQERSHYGEVDLGGAMVWIQGDLGAHFGPPDMTTEWAEVSFDRDTSPEQRVAIHFWIGEVFPVKWEGGVTVHEDDITWEDGEREANASLASGNGAIKLTKVFQTPDEQAVVHNTKYFNADSNDGFWLAHSEHFKKSVDGSPGYEYSGKTGFMVTHRISGTIEAEASD